MLYLILSTFKSVIFYFYIHTLGYGGKTPLPKTRMEDARMHQHPKAMAEGSTTDKGEGGKTGRTQNPQKEEGKQHHSTQGGG